MSEKDKRAYNINITKEGLTLLKSLDKELNSLSDVATTLSISEAFHLNALLDKLRTEL
jgi:DNA-directed RNA polymerase subunit L